MEIVGRIENQNIKNDLSLNNYMQFLLGYNILF